MEVYLALRTVVGLGATVYPQGTGQATPGQRFKGLVMGLDLAQSPVGCHITPMGGGAPSDCTDAQTNAVAQLNPKLTQSANTSSTFVAVPVPDTEDCAKLLADDPVLFKNQ